MKLFKLWFVPQDGPIILQVFDALAHNGKQFTVGCGIGGVDDAGFYGTQVAQAVMDRLCRYSGADAPLWLVEIAKTGRIGRRLRWACEEAPAGAALMLLCHTSGIIDGLLPFFDMQKLVKPT